MVHRLGIGAAAMALVLTGCGAPSPSGAIGGTVDVLAAWSGPEEESFRAMLRPFEEQTRITVRYHGTRDLQGVLWRGVATRKLPDVAGLPGPGQMAEFAQVGALVDLGHVIDQSSYKADTAPAFVSLGTIDGKLVGVFIKTTLKGLIWFNPKVFTVGSPTTWDDLWAKVAIAAHGKTRPWCVGLESGESSGWPGTDVIEDYLLRASGPEVYDEWVAGQLPWSSEPIRAAWEAFGRMVADGNVYGSPEVAHATSFMDAGKPLFTDPPGCLLMHGPTFMTQFFRSQAGARDGEYDFFPFPTVDPRYAGAVTGAGDLFGMFNDTPQARTLIRYLVTPEAQSIWVRRGGALSVNSRVTDYPDEISGRAARVLTTAKTFRFDGSDLMPEAMNQAFWEAVLEFTHDQTRLPQILEHLDVVRASAYSEY